MMSAQKVLPEALRTENEREIVRGFSPAQHALGKAPDLSVGVLMSRGRDLEESRRFCVKIRMGTSDGMLTA